MKNNFLKAKGSDFAMLVISLIGLLGIGLTMVLSASSVTSIEKSGNAYSIFFKQLLFVLVGLAAIFIIHRLDYSIWKKIARFSFLGGIFLLIAAVVLGRSVNGNKNWIALGPFSLQPSEFAKLAMILFCAHQMNKIEIAKSKGGSISPLIAVGPITVVFVGLILAGKDLGTALIFMGIAMILLFLAGLEKKYFLGSGALLIAGVAVLVVTQPNRLKRFKALLDPFAPDVYKLAGWQPAHSLMGLASGGLFGVGIGSSKQKWANLAEAHTDFIFSVIGEEMGLLGTLMVISLYILLLFAIFRISITSKSYFEKYAVAGIGIWFTLQILTNVATNIGIIPVIGVTLPFISYGGSSVVANSIAMGFIFKIALSQSGKESRSTEFKRIAS